MKIILIHVFTIISFLFAGNSDRQYSSGPLMPVQGITLDAYNSIGFSNIVFTTIFDLPTSNPASLNEFVSPSVGFNFEYSTPISNAIFGNIAYERSSPWLPSTIGFVYPFNEYKIGLTYHQKYSCSLDLGFPTTIEDNGGPAWPIFKQESEIIIHSYSLLASSSVEGILHCKDKLSIGVQICYDYLNSKEKFYKTTMLRNGKGYSWKIGTVYKFKNLVSLALMFEKGVEIEGKDFQEHYGILNETHSFVLLDSTYDFNLQLPNKLVFGLALFPIKNFSCSFTICSVFWNYIDNNTRDMLEISAGGIYRFPEFCDISFGFFNTDKDYKKDFFNKDYSAIYLSIGLKLKIKNIDVVLGLNDSHLFSGDSRKHTNIKLGFEYLIK